MQPCCNPDCRGQWGTNCYHCHHPGMRGPFGTTEPPAKLDTPQPAAPRWVLRVWPGDQWPYRVTGHDGDQLVVEQVAADIEDVETLLRALLGALAAEPPPERLAHILGSGLPGGKAYAAVAKWMGTQEARDRFPTRPERLAYLDGWRESAGRVPFVAQAPETPVLKDVPYGYARGWDGRLWAVLSADERRRAKGIEIVDGVPTRVLSFAELRQANVARIEQRFSIGQLSVSDWMLRLFSAASKLAAQIEDHANFKGFDIPALEDKIADVLLDLDLLAAHQSVDLVEVTTRRLAAIGEVKHV